MVNVQHVPADVLAELHTAAAGLLNGQPDRRVVNFEALSALGGGSTAVAMNARFAAVARTLADRPSGAFARYLERLVGDQGNATSFARLEATGELLRAVGVVPER